VTIDARIERRDGDASVLLALAGLADEPQLVRAASSTGLTVLRRCVDAADLLGAAAADEQVPVVVSAGLPRLSADVVARLGDRLVVGVAADALGRDRLARMGVDPVIDLAPSPESTMQQVADVCRARRPPRAAPAPPAMVTGLPERPAPPAATGSVVAVWGPPGAPGRTTIAIGLAEALAERGLRVCLVDADTYAPSIALALGLLESTSGLASACRLAEAGTLTPAGLSLLAMGPDGRGHRSMRVLGGLQSTTRWVDLRSPALDRVWETARAAFDVTVVDVGACLEVDETPGSFARQRNAAACGAIAVADRIVAVADSSALGAARLIAAWPELPEAQGRGLIVCNRATGGVSGWLAAVGARIPVGVVREIPEDRRALDQAWARGATLGEAARRSRVRRALQHLAADLVADLDVPETARAGRARLRVSA